MRMVRAVYIVIMISMLSITYAQESARRVYNQPDSRQAERIDYPYINPERAYPPKTEISADNPEPIVRNYFRIDESETSLWNGKHWAAERFPLKVYVEKSGSRLFKKVYIEYVKYAMRVWKEADSRIDFVNVSSDKDADIIITFRRNLRYKYEHDYLGITDYDLNDDKTINKAYVEVGMLKFEDELISQGEIKKTIIHEVGHALGLGHSDNQADLMFPYIDPVSDAEMDFRELSAADQLAVRSVISLGYLLPVILN